MNSQQIYDLMLDGAFLDVNGYKFCHPSFRKGYRKLDSFNISFIAAQNKLRKSGHNVVLENGIYKVI